MQKCKVQISWSEIFLMKKDPHLQLLISLEQKG